MPALEKRIETLDDPLCADFLATLRSADELELLSLSGNSYGLDFFRSLAQLLRPLRRVARLNLSDIFVTRKESIQPSLEALAEALAGKGVRHLDLSANALCPEGVAAVRPLIASNPLSSLLLDHVAMAQLGATTLGEAVREGGVKLRVLQLSKNRIEEKAADIARALRGQTELEELVVFQNAVKGEAMTALLEAAGGCAALRRLDISDNVIYDESREALLRLLSSCPQLEELNVGDCNISAELADAFFVELKRTRPSRLRCLGFNYNEVGSLQSALEALGECPALRSFSFKHFEHPSKVLQRAAELLPEVDCVWESEEEEEEGVGQLASDLAALKL